LSYAKSAAAAVEVGWKTIANKLVGAIQKIASIMTGSLYLALFAFKALISNTLTTTFLSHMALTSSKLSSLTANRRALIALGFPYKEEAMKIEHDSVDQVLKTATDAPSKDVMDVIVATHKGFTYPSIVQSARELIRTFEPEMSPDTAASIGKLADHLERAINTDGLTHECANLFKSSSAHSRKAMKSLLDAVCYAHS